MIKRTKADQAPYWTAPGGGVDDADQTLESALRRELTEELGADVAGVSRVLLCGPPSDAGSAVQYFFVARLLKLGELFRNGPEFTNAAQGEYALDRVSLLGDDWESINLQPATLKEFILANREALLAKAHLA